MTEPTKAVRDELDQHPWHETIPALVAYARKRMAHRTWSGARGGPLPAGKEAEDMVYEAIEKVLSGQRGWDPAIRPDLKGHLMDVIESDLHHLAVGFENRRVVSESILGDRSIEDVPEGFLNSQPSADPSPHDAAVLRESSAEAAAFAAAFLETLNGEPLLRQVVTCIFDGVVKPAEIAERTGVDITDIYNVRKRLQRILMDFYKDWGPHHEINPGR